MTLEKIEKSLALLFFGILVVLQAVVFVAVRANDTSQNLKAVFVEPSIGQPIDQGKTFYIQAGLSSTKYSDFSSAYFVWQNVATGERINYEADKISDGTWKAQSMIDTSQLEPGYYYIYAVAPIFENGNFVANLTSIPQQVVIAGTVSEAADALNSPGILGTTFVNPVNNQIFSNDDTLSIEATIDLDQDYNDFDLESARFFIDSMSSSADIHHVFDASRVSSNYTGMVALSDFPAGDYNVGLEVMVINTGQYVLLGHVAISIVDAPQVEDINPPEITIVSPQVDQEISGDLNIDVSTNRQLTINEHIVMMIDDGGRMVLNPTADNHFTLTVDTTAISGGEAVYANGDHNLHFLYYIDNQNHISPINLDSVSITINNQTEQPAEEPAFNVIYPQSGATIDQNSFTLNFQTNFDTETVQFQIYNNENPSISTATESIPRTNGTDWTRVVNLGDYFPDGQDYILHLEAAHESGDTIVSDIHIAIDRFGGQNPIPDVINLYLNGIDSNLEPGSTLIGSSNILGDFSFIFTNTANNEEITSLAQLIDCNQTVISASIRQEIQNLGSPYCFYKVISGDLENQLENGNYELALRYNGDTEVDSDSQLISYFSSQDAPPEEVNTSDIVVKLFDPIPITEANNQRLFFYVATNVDPVVNRWNLGFTIENSQGDILQQSAMIRTSWDEAALRGITREDNPDTPYIFYTNRDTSGNQILSQNGTYNVYVEVGLPDDVTVKSNVVNFDIVDSYLAGYGSDQTDENNQIDGNLQPIDDNTTTNVSSGGSRGVAISSFTSCLEAGISDQNTCLRFKAIMNSLDNRCINQGIYDGVACEDYLNRTEVDLECQQAGIMDKEQCKDYLLEKYGSQVDCQLSDTGLCTSILRNTYLNRLVVAQKRSDLINEAVAPLIGKNVDASQVSQDIQNKGVDTADVLPVKESDQVKMLLAPSTKETVLEDADKLTVINQAVLIVDSDGDGLSDDMESYYGTDPNQADSDGDGYPDGTEINNGYDPLGPGALVKERTDFDKVVLSNTSLEQPKEKSKKIDKSFEIRSIKPEESNVELDGKAAPNTWVNIYLYSSLPLVMTTKTDESGNWSYNIKQSLADGHHKVYVTVNDDTGKIVKQSPPISFLIKGAQAVTADSYFDENQAPDNVNNMLIYYILGASLLVIFALGIILFLHRGKRPDLEA